MRSRAAAPSAPLLAYLLHLRSRWIFLHPRREAAFLPFCRRWIIISPVLRTLTRPNSFQFPTYSPPLPPSSLFSSTLYTSLFVHDRMSTRGHVRCGKRCVTINHAKFCSSVIYVSFPFLFLFSSFLSSAATPFVFLHYQCVSFQESYSAREINKEPV